MSDRSRPTDPAVHTFLIADVRGYTRFTVEHGDEAAARLASSFAALAQEVVGGRDGAVVEVRGDEVLAVFSSARQALWAATELQGRVAEESSRAPELAMKIGIGLDAGEAIPVDAGYRGAALNLAARLCSLAGPGEVLASDTVISLARKVEGLEYVERGMVQLKGFADAVRVVQVSTEFRTKQQADLPGAPPTPIGGFLGALPTGPLVARDQELGRALMAVDAVTGGGGRLVLLAGEPGAGKTRLAQELTLHARNREFVVMTGICYESRQTVPYYPFLDALGIAYGAAPSEVRSMVAQRWAALGRLLPEAGIPVPPPGADGQQEQERLFRAVTGFLQALAERAPLALLLDDLHWADAASLDLLRHLAKHTRAHRVLILGTYRDVEVGRQHPLEGALLDLTREQLVERVAVRRLGSEGTAALIGAAFGEDEISAEFVELVHRSTEGNPFFTREVLRTLVERGDIFERDGAWDRREIEEIQVPESVRAVIGQRLSRLSEDAQDLLREAAVLGQTFSFDDVEAMSGRGEREVEAGLEEGVAAGLIREADRDGYAFNHALTQQALYGELSSRRRRRLHLAAGESLEHLPERKRNERVGELAWHFLEADEPEPALRYSMAAGELAQAVFAWSEAEREYRTALMLAEELGDRPRLARVSFELGWSLAEVGSMEEALPHLERAAQLFSALDDPVMEGRALHRAGMACNSMGRYQDCVTLLDQTAALMERVDQREPTRDHVLLYHEYSLTVFANGDLAGSVAATRRGIDAARAIGDEALVTRMELRLSEGLGLSGRIRDAITEAEALIPRAETAGDVEVLAESVSTVAEYSMLVGDLTRSLAARERERELCVRLGDAFRMAFTLSNLCQLHAYRGEWETARRYGEQGLAEGRAIKHEFVIKSAMGNLGRVALMEGRWEEARRLLEEAAGFMAGTLQVQRYILRDLAELDLLEGDPATALARLGPLIEGGDPEDNDIVLLLPTLALAQAMAGHVDEAARIAAEAVERASARQLAVALVDALWVHGMALARLGQREAAEPAFEEAVALARRMPDPYVEARALYEWAMAEADRGNTSIARDRLQQALSIARRLRAKKEEERIDRALESLRDG